MGVSPIPRSSGLLLSERYRILRKLGAGSFGTVYLVRDLLEERDVALKVIRPEHVAGHDLSRLQDEFRALADLRHPQLASAYDFGYTEQGRLPFYTREYVEGVPLAPGPPGAVAPEIFVAPIIDLLEALHYLHAQDILHLDLHSGNLIVAADPNRGAVLIDFGLVRPGRSVAARCSAEALPPELIAGEAPGPPADVHGAGRLILFRLTGEWSSRVRLPREIPGWGPRLTLELVLRGAFLGARPSPPRRRPAGDRRLPEVASSRPQAGRRLPRAVRRGLPRRGRARLRALRGEPEAPPRCPRLCRRPRARGARAHGRVAAPLPRRAPRPPASRFPQGMRQERRGGGCGAKSRDGKKKTPRARFPRRLRVLEEGKGPLTGEA